MARRVIETAPCAPGTGPFGPALVPTLCVFLAAICPVERFLCVGWIRLYWSALFSGSELISGVSRAHCVLCRYRRGVTHIQRKRFGGTCDKCGATIIELVDEMYVAGQTPGVDEPYDTQVIRAWCKDGCPGPDEVD